MKKALFFSLLLISSFACATVERALGSEGSPTPIAIVASTVPAQVEAEPTAITRKETFDVYCSSEKPEAIAVYNEGVAYETAGDIESAIKSYRAAIEFDPEYCDAMDNLALALRQVDQFEEAITWYQKSMEIAPDNVVSHLGLANTYMDLEQYDNALVQYNELMRIDPNNPEGFYGAGRVYFSKEDYNEAITQFKKAEELYQAEGSTYIIDAQTFIGFSYVMIEDYVSGRDYLELVYPQMQDSSYVNYFLGYCYYYGDSIKDNELAKKYLLRGRELGITLEPELEKFVNTP